MMTSRQRLQASLEHRQPDRVCVDLGATFVSGETFHTIRLPCGVVVAPSS